MSAHEKERSELSVVLLVAAVQFVNILDFVMVMPMGPDFSAALGIPLSSLGFIGGAYTFAAALAGLAGSLFLDRFERRRALGLSMIGLVAGTALGGFALPLSHLAPMVRIANQFHQPPALVALMAARVLAGIFGGPATSLALSIIADVIPPARRGRAMGLVMGAFALASVVGVPMGLRSAQAFGWQAPFFGTAAIGILVALSAVALLPTLSGHIEAARARDRFAFLALFRRKLPLLALVSTAVTMMAGFTLIPNISSYVQGNLGYPRGRIDLLYAVGGIFSLLATQSGGRLVDRIGYGKTALLGTAVLEVTLFVGFVMPAPPIPVLALFVLFMSSMGLRNVANQSLATLVPEPEERAGFMSMRSAVQHIASSMGAFLGAQLLGESGGKLVGMPTIAWITIALSALVPWMTFWLESLVKRRDAQRGAPPIDPLAKSPAAGPASAAAVAAPLLSSQR